MHIRAISRSIPNPAGYQLQVFLDLFAQVIDVILSVNRVLGDVFGIDVSEKVNPTS